MTRKKSPRVPGSNNCSQVWMPRPLPLDRPTPLTHPSLKRTHEQQWNAQPGPSTGVPNRHTSPGFGLQHHHTHQAQWHTSVTPAPGNFLDIRLAQGSRRKNVSRALQPFAGHRQRRFLLGRASFRAIVTLLSIFQHVNQCLN